MTHLIISFLKAVQLQATDQMWTRKLEKPPTLKDITHGCLIGLAKFIGIMVIGSGVLIGIGMLIDMLVNHR